MTATLSRRAASLFARRPGLAEHPTIRALLADLDAASLETRRALAAELAELRRAGSDKAAADAAARRLSAEATLRRAETALAAARDALHAATAAQAVAEVAHASRVADIEGRLRTTADPRLVAMVDALRDAAAGPARHAESAPRVLAVLAVEVARLDAAMVDALDDAGVTEAVAATMRRIEAAAGGDRALLPVLAGLRAAAGGDA